MTLKPSAGSVAELEWTKSSYSDNGNSNECVEVAWQKSSYSGQGNGNECLEVGWEKSSYSDSSNGHDCIEVATTPDTIRIRDSKNPHGPQLRLRPSAWADFVAFAVEGVERTAAAGGGLT